MTLVAIFFVSGADAASIVMGTLSQRGTIHPYRDVVVFWGVVDGLGRGADAAGRRYSDALSGIQNITIIMAAPFVLVMVAMCVALMKDLRTDPLVRRGKRSSWRWSRPSTTAPQNYGDDFYLLVKPHPFTGSGGSSAGPVPRQEEPVVRTQEERNGDRPLPRDRAEKATS